MRPAGGTGENLNVRILQPNLPPMPGRQRAGLFEENALRGGLGWIVQVVPRPLCDDFGVARNATADEASLRMIQSPRFHYLQHRGGMPPDADADGPTILVDLLKQQAVSARLDYEIILPAKKQFFASSASRRIEKRLRRFDEQ